MDVGTAMRAIVIGLALALDLAVLVRAGRTYGGDREARSLPHWPDDLELPIPSR